MQIEYIKVSDLIPYENNPRHNDASVDKVAESIRKFGFKVPIVVDKENVIVCGHTRWKAAKKLGMEEVPCVRADDLSDEQIRAFRLADNKVGESSTWDEDMLKLEIGELPGIDMSRFGFDLNLDTPDAKEDDYEVKLPEEPRSKRGEVWILGAHRVMCGDATDPEDVKKFTGNKAVREG